MFYSSTSSPTSPADVSLREFTISANTTLVWSFAGLNSSNTAARVMIVTASVPSLDLLLPPANQGQLGFTTMVINIGAESFNLKDNSGNIVDVITSGQVKIVALRTQATAAGTWLSYTLGATTASANAALLAGLGLKAITTTLNSDHPSTSFSITQSFDVNDRAQAFIWTGGTGAATFDTTSNLSNGWWMMFRNAGSGILTLTPDVTDMIDGQSTQVLNPTDSCIVICTGSALYTIGIGRAVTISDSRLVKNVAGSSDVTLNSSEYSNNIINFVGVLTGNINVIFPTSIKNYWLSNSTTGSFTLTVKTALGTGVTIPQTGASVVTSDGTNMITANTSNAGTVISVTAGTGLNGGTITTSGIINLANTGVTGGTYGDATHFPTFTVNGQGQLTSVSTITLGALAALGTGTNFQNNVGNLDFSSTPVLPSGATATTQSTSDNSTKLATTAFVASSISFIKTVKQQTFLSNGTYTPSAGMLYCKVRMVGGGAGASATGLQGGGGAGEYAEGVFTASDIGVSKAVTIGTGGSAGSNGNTTSLGALLTAVGGNTTASRAGGTGGTGGTGTGLHIKGGNGGGAAGSAYVWTGHGGNSYFGGAGGAGSEGGNGTNGSPNSGGGGGGTETTGTPGSGGSGLVVIDEYCYQ